MATMRQVLLVLENYQTARAQFSESIQEMSSDPQNSEMLHSAEIVETLRPLLIDCVPQIQQTSAFGLAKLANYEAMADQVVTHYVLPQLVFCLKEFNRYSKKGSASVLRSVARHTSDHAEAVVRSGGLLHLVLCLEEFDPCVREVGATGVANVAKHSRKLANNCVEAGALPRLRLCVQDPEISLKRAALGALAEIAKHAPEMARMVVSFGIVPDIASLVLHGDTKLKRQACVCLGQIARHTMDLAKVLVAADLFPGVYLCLKDGDHQLRREAGIVVREVAKHTPQLAHYIVSTGGVAALVDDCAECRGYDRLPAIMALGYIAAYDPSLAITIIQSNGAKPVVDALENEQEDHIQAASAWSLGQIGRHSSVHAHAASEAGVLQQLVSRLLSTSSSEDLKTKCKKALKAIIVNLIYVPALDSLLQGPILPDDLLKLIVAQLAEILPKDHEARSCFVTSGGLEKLLQVNFTSDPYIQAYIDTVNASYPKEVVQYYDPKVRGVPPEGRKFR